jgi:NAD(P)H-flavin reductase
MTKSRRVQQIVPDQPSAPDASSGSATEPGIFRIERREDFSESTFLLEISHPMMARAARAGQFVIVQLHDHSERIPLTIADFDRTRGTVTLFIQAVGKSTREMQACCQTGTFLLAMVGPMGVPSAIDNARKVVCVGGGLGVAPIYPQARAFKENGAYVIAVIGFRNRDLVFWDDKFKSCCDEIIICSDDGSIGVKGLVTDGIDLAIANHDDIDEVIAIGPPVMMKACAEATRPHGIKTTVSLNPIMVDGTGMCGGCRVKVGEGIKFACVDGPDFDGHAVDFDDLAKRLKRYAGEEAQAAEKWSETCRAQSQPQSQPQPQAQG